MKPLVGFDTVCARFGTAVELPSGDMTFGLFSAVTKSESISNFESQVMAGTPSVLLRESLKIGDTVTTAQKRYTVRDYESDRTGLTRYFLLEVTR